MGGTTVSKLGRLAHPWALLRRYAARRRAARAFAQRVENTYGNRSTIERREAAFSARLAALARVHPPPTETRESMIWPAAGPLNGTFGDRHGRMHYGIDVVACEGQPIRAAAHGIVMLVDDIDDYGTTTVVAHAGGVATVYGHQSETIVRSGEEVRQGDVIGLVGSTGRATGPHLHFEVRVDAIARDPVGFLPQLPGDDADGSPPSSGSAIGS